MAYQHRNHHDDDKDESELINDQALTHTEQDGEASLSEALSSNPAKIFFVRLAIKLKNHISVIPFFLTILAMIVITWTIPFHVNACTTLARNDYNAFCFFCNVLLSLVSVLIYLRVNSRKSSKKMVIIMMVLFFIIVAAELFLDYYYLRDVTIETSLYNTKNRVVDKSDRHYIANSVKWTNVHIVCLYIAAGAALLAPLLQPLAKKIHIKVK